MSDRIVQLQDRNDDNIYPVAGAATQGSITKAMLAEGIFEGPELSEPSTVAYVATDNIQDGAVTSDKIDWTTIPQLKSVTIGTATTTANGNISTTLSVSKTAPIIAYTDNNGAIASFYSYSGQTNWTLHLAMVSSGAALASTQVTGIKVYYLDSPENI